MRWRGVIGIGLWAAVTTGAGGQDYYVSHWGSNVPPYTSWATAATNLMDAVDAAADGATVWVSNGVYRTGSAPGGGIEARLALTRPVTVRSVNGSSNTFIEGAVHWADTPLGPAAVRGVYMTDGVLDGFTIRRGHTSDAGDESAVSGGGLYAAGGTQLNLRVIGNHGQTAGGAWLERCLVSNGVFRLNTSATGPRVKINRQVRLKECVIHNGPVPSPDVRILGTNGAVIVNGDVDMDAGNGAWFGPHHVATGTATHVFALTNRGVRPLVVSGVTAQGGHTADFAVISASAGVLQPGESMPLEIRFDPTAKGIRRVLYYVESNDPDDHPYAFWVGGEGLQYELLVLGRNGGWIENETLEPSLALGTDFGVYGTAPIRQRFAITNAGTELLTLTGTPRIVLAGEHAGDFRVTQQPVESLVPGDFSEFEIEFSPLVATTRTAEVHIYSDDPFHSNGLYRFAIRGECPVTNSFIDVQADLKAVGGSSMAWGDMDNDGLLDLAVLGYDGTNRTTDIYRNLGSGGFTNLQAGLVPLESGRLAWGDYDNDGWLDLAVSGISVTSAVTRIYRNMGDGTFMDIEAGLPGVMNGGLAWGDADNDGDLDLVITGYTLSTTLARVYRNNGDGTFTRMDQDLLPVQNGRAVWVDLDKSGWLDLILTGDSGTGKTTRVYHNAEGVLESYPSTGLEGSAYGGLCAGDFNGDSLPDLAMTGYGVSGMVARVYLFSGITSLFARTADEVEPLWLGTCEWGDVNNNGWLDLVTSGETAGSRRALNIHTNQDGTLSPMPTLIPGMRISSVALGDADSDGDLDLAVSGLTSNGFTSAVFRNLSDTSNAPPGAPVGPTATLTNGNEILFRWEAATDDRTPSASLTYNLYVGTAENPEGVMSPHADRTTGQRRIVAMGNMQYTRERLVKNLPSGEEIVWGVQAIDSAHAGGPFVAGDPVTTDLLPDLVIAGIQIREVPFQATVVVSNQGRAASSGPVILSGWLHRPAEAPCGTEPDWAQSVGILGVGETASVSFEESSALPAPSTNTFRAFVNSECESPVLEIRLDNNQGTRAYTNRIFQPFEFNAVALTDSVHLRWSDPVNSGMQSSEVMLRWSDSGYPATPADGVQLYNGTGQFYLHSGRPSLVPNFYSIWVTHDGMDWVEPPE